MTLNAEAIENFLRRVDRDFPVPLSRKQNLRIYASKLAEYATICASDHDGEIRSMVAGYTNTPESGMAYIAIVATALEARGKGLAAALLTTFLGICSDKGFSAVHLYTTADNEPAMAMYVRQGFEIWDCPGEPRPEDVHLIKYL